MHWTLVKSIPAAALLCGLALGCMKKDPDVADGEGAVAASSGETAGGGAAAVDVNAVNRAALGDGLRSEVCDRLYACELEKNSGDPALVPARELLCVGVETSWRRIRMNEGSEACLDAFNQYLSCIRDAPCDAHSDACSAQNDAVKSLCPL